MTRLKWFLLFAGGIACAIAPPLILGPPWAHGAISPMQEIMAARFGAKPKAIRYDFDKRLASFPDKLPVACPAAGPRTAVLLIAGQSNAANSAGQKYRSTHGADIANFFDGKCYKAQSPLLGSTGEWGEPWTPMANRLIESGAYDRVVLAPVAVGGSSIDMWTKGKLRGAMIETLTSLERFYQPTAVIWYQGEADFMLDTSEQTYRDQMKAIISLVRKPGQTIPVYVTSATRCANSALDWTPDNPVSRAQRSVVDPSDNVFSGADPDGLLSGLDRYDDCHLSASGVDKLADAWVKLLAQR